MSNKYRGPVLKHPLSNLKEQERQRVNIGNPDSKGMFWPDQLSSKDAGATTSYEVDGSQESHDRFPKQAKSKTGYGNK